MKRSVLALALAGILAAGMTAPVRAAEGSVIGHALYTDIQARIDGHPIGQKVKQVQHLNYGTLRQVSASRGIFWDEN